MVRRNEPDGPRRQIIRKIPWVAGPLNFVGRLADGEPGTGHPAPSADLAPGRIFPAGTFLGRLGAAYAAELAEDGRRCVFTIGDVLFRAGEPARNVFVILEGNARIESMSGDVIAMRGPGDLIGERAASLEPRRSATAVAIDELHAIQVEAGNFAAFLNRHPDALKELEGQLYFRMTAPDRSHTELSGQNCTVLLVDITRFSDATRTDRDRLAIIKACYRMLEDAFTSAGVDWNACHSEDRGDGALVIIPGHVPTEDVVHPLVRRLAANLRRYNKRALAGRRFTLRVAVDVGPVTAHEHGVNGETIISAARLVEATRLKAAVLEPDVVIGIATSPFVFERVARHLPEADTYEEVKFKVKDWRASAWMRLYRL